MTKKIVITVGGTGGHVYPAMSLAKDLLDDIPGVELLFVGGKLKGNRYFERAAFPYHEVSCATLSLKKPFKAIKSAWKILQGIWQSRRILQTFKPDLIIGFGSFYTLPALLAAKLNRIPILLHEADRIPGKVNRMLSPYAQMTAIHFADTAHRIKGKSSEVKFQLRSGYQLGSTTQQEARKYFQLYPDVPTLLTFGGSQGAVRLNLIVMQALIAIAKGGFSKIQIIHFTGDLESASHLQQQYNDNGIMATVKAFESRMDLAWQAADCAICRAGAGTVAEALEFEVPCFFIPYPYATENHQTKNADYIVNTIGAARMYQEKDISPEQLSAAIRELLIDNSTLLKNMRLAIRAHKRDRHPQKLSALVKTLTSRH